MQELMSTKRHRGLLNVILVDTDASGANNGTSWADAYTSLQSALIAATAGKEIWVAEGTYTPAAANGNRMTSFDLKANVAVYGGFSGNESTRNARDFTQHVTLLSGDLNGNDNYASQPFGNISENSYHVVRGATDATLDGFTLQGGYADGTASGEERNGGGMLNVGTSPSLSNLIFQHNRTERYGGGLIISNASPILENLTFSNNTADDTGDAIEFDSGSPTYKNLLFWNNDVNVLVDLGTGLGNVIAATDPFVNSSNPNGSDGIPRTSDDGLRISASSSGVLNTGINTGAFSTDILGNPRPGASNANAEPGAYEYTP